MLNSRFTGRDFRHRLAAFSVQRQPAQLLHLYHPCPQHYSTCSLLQTEPDVFYLPVAGSGPPKSRGIVSGSFEYNILILVHTAHGYLSSFFLF